MGYIFKRHFIELKMKAYVQFGNDGSSEGSNFSLILVH